LDDIVLIYLANVGPKLIIGKPDHNASAHYPCVIRPDYRFVVENHSKHSASS
jgi:hypothetical protein